MLNRLKPRREIEAYKCSLAIGPRRRQQQQQETAASAMQRLRILDVGAGPLSTLGNECRGRPVELIPTDLLAPAYDRTLDDLGVQPPVRTRHAAAEQLTRHFALEFFDLVHCSNALDHAQNPFVALVSMLSVVKRGHAVVITTRVNESKTMQGTGMHRYDLFADAREHFILSPADGTRALDVTAVLEDSGAARVSVRLEPVWRPDGGGVKDARDCPMAAPHDCRMVITVTRTAATGKMARLAQQYAQGGSVETHRPTRAAARSAYDVLRSYVARWVSGKA